MEGVRVRNHDRSSQAARNIPYVMYPQNTPVGEDRLVRQADEPQQRDHVCLVTASLAIGHLRDPI
jgi:hypothetical protein